MLEQLEQLEAAKKAAGLPVAPKKVIEEAAVTHDRIADVVSVTPDDRNGTLVNLDNADMTE